MAGGGEGTDAILERSGALRIANAAFDNRTRGRAGDGADHRHHAHRATGADDIDVVAGTQLAGRGDAGQGIRRAGGGGRGEADVAVVDAADRGLQRSAEAAASGGDQDQAIVRDQGEEVFDQGGVGTDDEQVVDAARGEVGAVDRGEAGRGLAAEEEALGRRSEIQAAQVEGTGTHEEEGATGGEGAAFDGAEGVFDAGPRFDQGELAGGTVLRHGQEVAAAVGGDGHPFIKQDVLLEAALKVVAKGTVGIGGLEVAEVGLDEVAAADAHRTDRVANLQDAEHGLMSRDGRLLIRDIARDVAQNISPEVGEHGALPRVTLKLVQQLHV